VGRGSRIVKPGLVASALILLSGCQSVGPISIDAGRDRYNSSIQSTAKIQTLANIIRVANHDSTSFMDVTEVDATTTLSSTANGTVAGIGSKPGTFGTLGTVMGGVTYSEAPLVRYVPLVGQGLVAQMVRPLTVDAIESVITSNWPAIAVLDLTALSLTPNQRYTYAALNIISLLAFNNDVMLVAGKSELTNGQDSSPLLRSTSQDKNSNNAGKIPANDSLTIFLRPSKPDLALESDPRRIRKLWQKLAAIYAPTQKNAGCPPPRACLPASIELRTGPVPAAKALKEHLFGAPLLKTYSGIGILKNATELPEPKVSLVPRAKFDRIRRYRWNNPAHNPELDLGFYTLLPDDENLNENPKVKSDPDTLDDEIAKWINDAPVSDPEKLKESLFVYEPAGSTVPNADFIRGNRKLGSLRRYVLIICDDVAPMNAYAAYPYQGQWYYIDGDDHISQKNFNLISLLLTIMSVPSSTPPLTTSIATGGG
jgi:hypothetical protein